MKQRVLKLFSIAMACAMSISIFASCGDNQTSTSTGGSDSSSNSSSSSSSSGGGTSRYDDEKDALVFNSGEFDEVFSPFFSTSAYDSAVVGQTQISMLTSDDNGDKVEFGKDKPVVTLDYNETMYDRRGNETTQGDEQGTTVYQMVLKKDILFSDGEPLTAHDVLFNMYMYLDPAYTGSSTMYSTAIKGLKDYQAQEIGASDDRQAALEQTFSRVARQRMSTISAYVTPDNTNWGTLMGVYNNLRKNSLKIQEEYTEENIKEDILTVKKLWAEEITSDYNGYASDLESYKKEYPFTEGWQVYFYSEGIISRKSVTNGGVTTYPKDKDGKFEIDWQGINPNANYTKEEAIATVHRAYLGADSDGDGYGDKDEFIATILGGWATAGTVRAQFAAEDRSAYYNSLMGGSGELKVKNISGIEILSGSEFKGDKKYDEDYSDYEMLQITIDGVDPKAKWNFAFSVAPMHYYSTPELTKAALEDTNYESHFGVEFTSPTFMDQVKRRNKVPMGAGIYQATTINDYKYDWSNDSASFNRLSEEFLKDGICYFIRNENFYTTGGNTNEVYNTTINHIRYKVVNSANTMTALQGGTIHYADPSSTTENIAIVDGNSSLQRIMSQTAGYGYIGINAKYVNDINIRRAIMSVMDISLVQSYYPGTLSEPLYRSYSKTSWVYNEFDGELEAWRPEDNTYPDRDDLSDVEHPTAQSQYYGFDKTFKVGRAFLQKAGCRLVNGRWQDKKGNPLKYTFTVAGDTTDHPAYATFLQAVDILNNNGWDVNVIPDSRALYKLASGGLAIWAAAWSSTIDPDMYQVYHKNSKATSILNWGYDYIAESGTSEEKRIVDEISDLIDDARKTINASERATLYRDASDLVMELAVELPVYQRSDMYVYNNTVLDSSTFYKNITAFAGPLSEMWKVSFK